ncbi:MucR family transcriptional regulator [Sphingomonas sp. AR_OL41]|uniref:MucR family transcriptional regulator n=1 Tax=Sphingomonas sp. AR_OL41 TaxID=3042729 RepID=UPI00247FC67F|nr:MucR family transcriptional regulator [Sphingomonas sp. AR_OL41]MDH7975707.1 MucR family transcriptional regulator [Sphingomonas sp. AR_OL41]
MANSDLLTLTADIISAHVENNSVALTDLPRAISTVYEALAGLGSPAAPIMETVAPAVSIKSSVKPDSLTCLECGAKQKALKKHIGAAHDLTPDQYRAKWKLPASYPMVSANYAAQRSEMARRVGFGRKPGAKVTAKTPKKG